LVTTIAATHNIIRAKGEGGNTNLTVPTVTIVTLIAIQILLRWIEF